SVFGRQLRTPGWDADARRRFADVQLDPGHQSSIPPEPRPTACRRLHASRTASRNESSARHSELATGPCELATVPPATASRGAGGPRLAAPGAVPAATTLERATTGRTSPVGRRRVAPDNGAQCTLVRSWAGFLRSEGINE